MGLGLNSGGLASDGFLQNWENVTVTDLRDENTLKSSIELLEDLDIRYVLGRHQIEDFKNADLVIKNPAVRLTHLSCSLTLYRD